MFSTFGRNVNKNHLNLFSNNLFAFYVTLSSKTLLRDFYETNANKLSVVSDKLRVDPLNGRPICRYLWGRKREEEGMAKGVGVKGVRIKDVTLASRLFKEIPDRHKEHFLQVVDNFDNYKSIRRHGYAEFITAALPFLKEFGVHRDIEVYKALMNIFPKGKYRPDNIFAAFGHHYILEQRAAVSILCQMETNGVIPDKEMENMIIEIFSKYSHPWRKCGRMNYWMTKFRNANPFPIPDPLPLDALELALLALKRMCVDVQTKISVLSVSIIDNLTQYLKIMSNVLKSAQISDSIDKTWIASAQSPIQRVIINELPANETVYVEGPTKVWLRSVSIDYFILRANNPNPVFNRDDDNIDNDELNDVSSIPLSTFGKEDKSQVLEPTKNIHIQDDGKVLAICATGTSSRDSLLSWVRLLQTTNPRLKTLPIVFTLRGTPKDVQTVQTVSQNPTQSTDALLN